MAAGVSFVELDRCERINGQLVPRPTSGDTHSDIQEILRSLLAEQAKTHNMKARQEWSITQPDGGNLDDPDYLTPDVLVARLPYGRTKAGHLIPPAFLAIEVVSPAQDDLFDKARIYSAWGVEHVWIVNPQRRNCFEYHGGDQFKLVTDELRAGDLVVRIQDLFAAL